MADAAAATTLPGREFVLRDFTGRFFEKWPLERRGGIGIRAFILDERLIQIKNRPSRQARL